LGVNTQAQTLDSLILFWQKAGTNPQEQFGLAISKAGDVNGDGYEDFLVGANAYDTPDTNSGAAFLFFGGSGTDTIADLVVAGIKREFLGGSVTGLGDFNGDGYDDFAAGAAFYDSSRGRVLVFYGGNPPDTIADLIIQGDSIGDNFGIALAGPGDITGDGWPDLLIGAHLATVDTFQNTGKVYVLAGGPGADATIDFVIPGKSAGERFGFSLAGVQNVVGDPYNDFAVGAFSFDLDTLSLNVGRVYLFAGGTGLDTIPDAVFTGEQAADLFGWSVAGTGDVGGDGKPDILVGAYGYNVGIGTEAGKVYVYYGGSILDTIADLTYTASSPQNIQLGRSVSSAGDLTGDGLGEWLAGAPASDSGTSFAFIAADSDPASPDTSLTGIAPGIQFGRAQTELSNFAGSGSRCFAVGSWAYDTFRGLVQVFCISGDSLPDSTCIAKPGDVDGTPPISLPDVIHLVNYVFDKDRPATSCLGSEPGNCWTPNPLCQGEVNGTPPIGLPDVIHLVNYVFDKDRPATSCLGSSPGNCWTPVATDICCQPVQ
jgi:hypothetical protein